MSNFFEELKRYFEVTPREKVLEDWAKSAEFDKIGSTVDDFLNTTQQYFKVHSKEPLGISQLVHNSYNLKFSSGFFMPNQKLAICKKLHFQ